MKKEEAFWTALGVTLGAAMMGGLIWLVAWAIGQENSPEGRDWDATGVAGLEQACTDSGYLLFRQGTRTLAIAAEECEPW